MVSNLKKIFPKNSLLYHQISFSIIFIFNVLIRESDANWVFS